jgi:magnesium chelatase accessory protein
MSVRPPDLPENWPNRAASMQIAAIGQRWHVQIIGAGPAVLLIHGAGGSLHSWQGLTPLLAPHHRMIALDVAGHGFSQKGRFARAGLQDVAHDIAALAQDQGWDIHAIIGHSAGAAVALRLAQILPVCGVIGLNSALSQFDGVAGWLFPALAKTLSLVPFAPQMASKLLGQQGQIDRLLAQTGAQIGTEGRAHYLTLARRPAHIAATLDMMAAWDLRSLLRDLSTISQPVLLLTGSQDHAVAPNVSLHAARGMPNAQAQVLKGYGHLLPEECPDILAPMLLEFLGALNAVKKPTLQ